MNDAGINADDVSRYMNGRSVRYVNGRWHVWITRCREHHKLLAIIVDHCDPCKIGHWVAMSDDDCAKVLRAKQKKLMSVLNGQVYLHPATNRKTVARKDQEFEVPVVVIANRPHGDGDFNYLCGSTYCRCCQ